MAKNIHDSTSDYNKKDLFLMKLTLILMLISIPASLILYNLFHIPKNFSPDEISTFSSITSNIINSNTDLYSLNTLEITDNTMATFVAKNNINIDIKSRNDNTLKLVFKSKNRKMNYIIYENKILYCYPSLFIAWLIHIGLGILIIACNIIGCLVIDGILHYIYFSLIYKDNGKTVQNSNNGINNDTDNDCDNTYISDENIPDNIVKFVLPEDKKAT